MVIDRTQFERRVKGKLISKQQQGNLIIYNYTNDCAWNKQWDRYTMMARGLIVTTSGKVMARPFPKFFNLDETEKTKLKNLPTYHPEIVEKMDGSLGILYKDGEGKLTIATRGSFTSDQAVWATNWIRTHSPKDELLENITYLFEIIYPENRIVLDYGDRAELVLIGLVHNFTGKIMPHEAVAGEAKRIGYSCPNKANISLATAMEHAENAIGTEEGYVIFYPDEQLMLKVKLKDYVRLHRLMFGISVKSIWENMMWGQDPIVIFEDAPDEVMDWIKDWTKRFKDQEQAILDQAEGCLQVIRQFDERRKQALYIKMHYPTIAGVVFAMLDDKSPKHIIYKMIKPSKEDSAKSFKVVKQETVEVDENGHDLQCNTGIGKECDCWKKNEDN